MCQNASQGPLTAHSCALGAWSYLQVLECLSKKADAGKAVQGEGGAAVNESHDAPAAVQEVLVGAYASAVEAATQPPPSCSSSSSADELYQQLVKLGLLRR